MASESDAIFLKNCWYVAAWDHELIDGAKLARTILEKPVVLYRGESGRVVAMEDRCCHRGAPLSMGRIEGDCIRCMYHGMKFEPVGQVHPDPGPGRHPGQARRAQLSGRRARSPGLDLDGRPGARRRVAHRRLRAAARPGLARHAGVHALRRQLAPDRRQPERLRAPRLRPHQDARRLRGVRLPDAAAQHRAPRRRLSGRALAHEQRPAAVPQEGDRRQDRQGRPPQHRPHEGAGDLLPRVDVRAGGQRAPRRATSPARASTATASS